MWFPRTKEDPVEREARKVFALWTEAGSRGLDTWFELPAGYAIPDGSGGEPGRSYEYFLSMEDHLATLFSGEQAHEACYEWVAYERAGRPERKIRCSGPCYVAVGGTWKRRMRNSS
jgi:hypothetical protein